MLVLLCLTLTAFAAGCQSTVKTFSVERPVRHSVRGTGFVIQSNFPIKQSSPLVSELESLRSEIQAILKLGRQRDPVTVYLFADEKSYRRYMHATWPNLPPRRAYFVGTSRELAVYSYRGPKVEEDLRHEFTHGLLHASLNTVPLWLDEGLAEYFEVRGGRTGAPHREHLAHLQRARAEGWNPSLQKLEELADFKTMTQRHYAESWGWVHFMLNGNAAGRQTLIDYLTTLQTEQIAPPLLPQLQQAVPGCYSGMIAHMTNLGDGVRLASFKAPSR